MTKEELLKLNPGDKVYVLDHFMGAELYGWEDAEDMEQFLGEVITVRKVHDLPHLGTAEVYFDEDDGDKPFLAEEIVGPVFSSDEDLGDMFSSDDFSLLNLLGGGESFAC